MRTWKLRIKYMYEKGDTYFLEMMFDSASLSEFLSQAEYISKISEYDRTMLTAYQETKDLIAEKSEQTSDRTGRSGNHECPGRGQAGVAGEPSGSQK